MISFPTDRNDYSLQVWGKREQSKAFQAIESGRSGLRTLMKLPWPIEREGKKVPSPSPGSDAHQIEAKHQAKHYINTMDTGHKELHWPTLNKACQSDSHVPHRAHSEGNSTTDCLLYCGLSHSRNRGTVRWTRKQH